MWFHMLLTAYHGNAFKPKYVKHDMIKQAIRKPLFFFLAPMIASMAQRNNEHQRNSPMMRRAMSLVKLYSPMVYTRPTMPVKICIVATK